MEPQEILQTHLSLCEEVHALLLEENTWLKVEQKVPEMNFLNRKKNIVAKLESSLGNLKKLKPEFFSPFDDSKRLVGESHSKLLQIFYLDRENEEMLLKLSQPDDRQSFHRFSPSKEDIDDVHSRHDNKGPRT